MAEKKSSPWVWLTLIVIVAIFVMFILFLDQKIVKSGRENAADKQPRNKIDKPVIDFYSVLPEREFKVPTVEVEQSDTPNKPAEQLKKEARYMLQAGSFKKPEDAERRKAELAFLGLESSVIKASVNGDVYHRVELGPFVDNGYFSKVKNRLITHDIQYIPKTIR